MKKQLLVVCGWILGVAGMSLSAAQVHGPARHAAAPAPTGPKIKVLLEKDAASAFLEAKGAYRVIRKDSGTLLSFGNFGKRFVVHALQDGLRWGEEYPDVYQITVVPAASDASLLINGIQYKGAVSIYHVKNNHITIVNEISIEDYLKSTLVVQYEASMPKEAMAALAIAARTEAYSKALQGETSPRPWDIGAQEAGYYGYGITQRKNGTEEAVDWTRFMVLESVKQSGPAQNVRLLPERASELAGKGYDAQRILATTFPDTKLSTTINSAEVSIR